MPIDLVPLRDNLFTQLGVLLAIIGIVLVIVNVATQNMGRAFVTGLVVIVVAGLMIAFKNLDTLGEWFNKTVFKLSYISTLEPHSMMEMCRFFLT
ncbi:MULTISPECIES: hypothetical protein [Listeria]|uniref:Uncharacterized protein n=1 Tax=Listeria seeligeri TaxID=1640 RepID=A0A7X1C7H5_LISSE|nr:MULTISPECIES: hypothetical protein [Listeria]EAD1625528.1 hypothetical protein [Listeria monocytogenes]EAE3734153.1 hypothetical protein [Listeria monocytogenes]EAE3749700.1 hypothetical protein [Listeria monocytogenes]EAE5773691.1 hypothetical protein [Listeria monocytogenes]EAE6178234.1 hypothetical protein [Listeria monocytogenes]